MRVRPWEHIRWSSWKCWSWISSPSLWIKMKHINFLETSEVSLTLCFSIVLCLQFLATIFLGLTPVTFPLSFSITIVLVQLSYLLYWDYYNILLTWLPIFHLHWFTLHIPDCSFFFKFFIFYIVVDFVIHWNETAMGLHVFPIPIPPPTSLSTRSL